MSSDRDRDDAGRARNARPRDRTGRPLPRGSAGTERFPDDVVLEPSAALAEAERLLREELPFQAHEVLEGAWKARRDAGCADAALFQALAQLAVGLTHLQRGNDTGAVTLLRRGAENLLGQEAEQVPVDALRSWAEDLADSVSAEPTAGADRVAARPPLTG